MKFEFMRTILLKTLTVALVAFGISCSDSASNTSGQARETKTNDTLTAAYTRLYDAVKKKDIEGISKEMSQNTLRFVAGAAAKQKVEVDKVLENGLTATTFAATLPEIRDERMNGGFGAVEVWNEKDKVWDDLPFVIEGGVWKLAVGEMFSDSFKSPGKGRSIKEKEAANLSGAAAPPTTSNGNSSANSNSNSGSIQVEPEPKTK